MHLERRNDVDDQEMHDLQMAKQAKVSPDSKKRLEALLKRKSAASSEASQSGESDPIARAMAQNPGLTREKAEAMAEAFGF